MEHKTTLPISIYDYFDYRDYLRAVYSHLKQSRYGFSHRLFCREAGLSSPNHLHRVMSGQRRLSEQYIPHFCKALKLSASESRYFEAIVGFTDEKKAQRKEEYLRIVLSLRHAKSDHSLQDKRLNFFEKWYYPVLRELVTVLDFKEDFRLLGRACVPPISAVQAQGAVKFLVKNGFIAKNPDGSYRQLQQVVSSGPEVDSIFIRKYHRKTIQQCALALDTIDKKERDISSLTLSVSKETYKLMKKEIQDFRKRLIAMAENDPTPQVVCFCGFQLLPRSKDLPKLTDSKEGASAS